MNQAEIQDSMYRNFAGVLEGLRGEMPPSISHLGAEIFLRTKNVCEETVTQSSLHDGASLWRKWLEIKKVRHVR
jgi:hypothetical protein